MLQGVMSCLITDVSSDPLCSIFNSEVALGYLGPWRWHKHPPRRCRTAYRSGLKARNISIRKGEKFHVQCLNTKHEVCRLSRNVGNELRITRQDGGLNCTATKTLNVPSVGRSHCCNVETHTDTAEGLLIYLINCIVSVCVDRNYTIN